MSKHLSGSVVFFLIFLSMFLFVEKSFGKNSVRSLFIQELLDQGDGFRALSLMLEDEFQNRRTPTGMQTAKNILVTYLKYQEYGDGLKFVERVQNYYPDFLDKKTIQQWYFLAQSPKTCELLPESELCLLFRVRRDPWKMQSEIKNCSYASCPVINSLLIEDQQVPRKNLWLAGILGVVPGMGQVYAGYPLGGLASFLINGSLIGISGWAFGRGEKAFGIASGALAATFYGASIYAGVEASRRRNELIARGLKEKIQRVSPRLEIFQWKFQ